MPTATLTPDKPVLPATETRIVHVVVDQGHINRGVACDTARCPIALALLDLDVPRPFQVGNGHVAWERGLTQLPQGAVTFIAHFDNTNQPAAPLEFDLEVPA